MAKAEEAAEQDAARPAGRQEVWPTLWDKAQLAFPWGGAVRLRKRPAHAVADDKRAEEQERRDA